MLTVIINGQTFLIKKELSILEACKYIGINLPHFCYHEILPVAGNCRMCLVEITTQSNENPQKLIAACALPISDGIHIYTNTPAVKKARENIIEALLINHPLDCPICDQAGECDLQDQVVKFGISNSSRFFFKKRAIEDKFFSPVIHSVMSRCIHCTRCIRFDQKISNLETYGLINRGNSMEISTYTNLTHITEISANVIDLCPVGALTSKPYAFKARPWELKAIESIDITDSFGSNIYITFKDLEIFRILPKVSLNLNETIITDRVRFFFDGISHQRLCKLFKENNNKFKETSWSIIIKELFHLFVSYEKILILINPELDLESIIILKALECKYQKILELRINDTQLKTINFNYLNKKNSLYNFETKKYQLIFLFTLNLHLESSILNIKLRNKYINESTHIFSLGTFNTNSFYYQQIINLTSIKKLHFFEGKFKLLSILLLKSSSTFFFFNENFTRQGFYYESIKKLLSKITFFFDYINIKQFCNSEFLLQSNIRILNKKNLSLTKNLILINLKSTQFLYFLLKKFKQTIIKKTFWFNTHGSNCATLTKNIIPILTYFEEENLYLNLDQKLQKTESIPYFNNSNIISIKKFLFLFLSNKTILDNLFNINYFFYETLYSQNILIFNKNFSKNFFKLDFDKVTNIPFKPLVSDFYLINNISKNSLNMLKISEYNRNKVYNF